MCAGSSTNIPARHRLPLGTPSAVRRIAVANDEAGTACSCTFCACCMRWALPRQMADSLQHRQCMGAGADVTHPAGFNKAEPSIAAVVGSMDQWCGRFATKVSLQGHRLEIIQASAASAFLWCPGLTILFTGT